MKTKNLVGALLLCLAAIACTPKPPEPAVQITPMEVAGLLANDFGVVVDVREDNERTEVIEKARHVPMSDINADGPRWQEAMKQLPKDKKIIFHCVAGGRAHVAADKLAKAGFKTAYFGIDDWKEAKLPVKAAK